MPYLNLADIRECTVAEGPGRRFAIWCQGCRRQCPGCCNPHMQPLAVRHIVDTAMLKLQIKKAQIEEAIEGITLVGGEPVLQAEGVADIAGWCRQNGLSVLLFSGFLYEELLNMHNSFVDDLLANTDILVDGPFIEAQYDYERDWVGSANQRVIFLSDRYAPGVEKARGTRLVECYITDSEIKINGWPLKL